MNVDEDFSKRDNTLRSSTPINVSQQLQSPIVPSENRYDNNRTRTNIRSTIEICVVKNSNVNG